MVWSIQLVPLIFQEVEFQSFEAPPPDVVTDSEAVIEAEGATVTLADPFRVAEFIVLAADTGCGSTSVKNTRTRVKNENVYKDFIG